MVPNRATHHICLKWTILSLCFAVSNIEWKTLQFPVSLCKLISGKILLHNLWAKLLSSNETTGSFDHQYIWKEFIDILVFLYGDIHQGYSSQTTTFGCVCPVIPSHTQICLDLQRILFGSHGGIHYEIEIKVGLSPFKKVGFICFNDSL